MGCQVASAQSFRFSLPEFALRWVNAIALAHAGIRDANMEEGRDTYQRIVLPLVVFVAVGGGCAGLGSLGGTKCGEPDRA